jgi:hypothetical protein
MLPADLFATGKSFFLQIVVSDDVVVVVVIDTLVLNDLKKPSPDM